jgi:hypothetical protein
VRRVAGRAGCIFFIRNFFLDFFGFIFNVFFFLGNIFNHLIFNLLHSMDGQVLRQPGRPLVNFSTLATLGRGHWTHFLYLKITSDSSGGAPPSPTAD